jgi:uncharacterized phage protein gp47/JayE
VTDLYNHIADTYENILKRMKDKFTQLAGYAPDDASDVGIRMKVLAGEVYSLGCAIDWLKRQTFAQTATGGELEKRAMERGVTRKPAAAASGTLTFGRNTALWYAVPIPAGTVCATSGTGAARYVTTQDAELSTASMSVDVPAKAEKAGTAGDTDAGTVTVMVTPPSSIEFVTNKSAFTGGGDAEDDDSLRKRLLDCWAEPANGTNAAWYRQLAVSFDGVFSAGVVPRANGVGTAAVYLGGVGEAAADGVVQQVRAAFQEKREIGTDVTVQAAQTVPVDVSCTAKAKAGRSDLAVKMEIRAEILRYFRGLGVGEPAVLSAMTSRIFETGLVDDCTFSTAGKTVAANQLAVAGNIAVMMVK